MEAGDQVVVRGGSVRSADVLMEQILDNAHMGDVALSVFADRLRLDESENDCIARICRAQRLPHGKVQRSSRARLEAAGFDLTHEPAQGQGQLHYHVHFKVPVTESQVTAFVGAFDPPELNPAKERSQ